MAAYGPMPVAPPSLSVEGVAPWLWKILVLPLTLAPAALVGLVIGAVLLWLGQPARQRIGFLSGP